MDISVQRSRFVLNVTLAESKAFLESENVCAKREHTWKGKAFSLQATSLQLQRHVKVD